MPVPENKQLYEQVSQKSTNYIHNIQHIDQVYQLKKKEEESGGLQLQRHQFRQRAFPQSLRDDLEQGE